MGDDIERYLGSLSAADLRTLVLDLAEGHPSVHCALEVLAAVEDGDEGAVIAELEEVRGRHSRPRTRRPRFEA